MNYYEILQINNNATNQEIKEAYFRLAKKYHPDRNKNQDSKRRFAEIRQAYEILSDPLERRDYNNNNNIKENNVKNNNIVINTSIEITENEAFNGTLRKLNIFDKGLFINQDLKIPKGIKNGQKIRLVKNNAIVMINVKVV